MKLPRAHEMQTLDRCAIEDFDIPGIVLMENAGLGSVLMMEKELGPAKNHFAVIFIGPGNNGGDGLVIGRHLHQRGCEPVFFFLVNPDELKGSAATNLNIIRKLKLPYHVIADMPRVQTIPVLFKQMESRGKPCYALIDAIFGIGLTRQVSDHFAAAIDLINSPDFAHTIPRISVDIPSGMDSDSGRIQGKGVKADLTATFGFAKPGQIMHGGAGLTGKLHIIDIGIPPEVFRKVPVPTELISEDMAAHWLRQLTRDKSSHKGTHGHLLILAGSIGKTGAAILSARGALRSGCGLVSLCVPYDLNPIFEASLIEAMTIPLPTSSSILNMSDLPVIEKQLREKEAVVLGPGLGTDPRTADLVLHLYNTVPQPMVIDADALNVMAANRHLLQNPAGPRILTPHPGELARLIDSTTSEIQNDRLQAARTASDIYNHDTGGNVIIVLKGDGTIVVSSDGNAMINITGNPGMATGGMGDVLSGIIGALVCQGLSCQQAAGAGVFLHGTAGDGLFAKTGHGYTATELADNIPVTLKSYTQETP
ncbi:MAG: NAD(P)H-hydrate dehydratase [Desulfocapsaceae bacterium]|nr:NAD(P)H-hydrate dehydratase [Desulfocapsaceae bacterium]